MLDLLKLRYNCINRNITLRVYSITDQEIIKFMRNNTSKQKEKGIFDLPDDSARLFKDEIKGEEEYNEELRRKKNNVDDAPFDFDQAMGFDSQNGAGKFGVNKTSANSSLEFNDMN